MLEVKAGDVVVLSITLYILTEFTNVNHVCGCFIHFIVLFHLFFNGDRY